MLLWVTNQCSVPNSHRHSREVPIWISTFSLCLRGFSVIPPTSQRPTHKLPEVYPILCHVTARLGRSHLCDLERMISGDRKQMDGWMDKKGSQKYFPLKTKRNESRRAAHLTRSLSSSLQVQNLIDDTVSFTY